MVFDFTEESEKSIRDDLAWTEVFMFFAFILMVTVFIIGILRRRQRYGKLQFLAWLPYSMLFIMIPCIVGLIIINLFFGGKLLIFLWAVFLLFISGSVDNFNAVDLDDRRRGKVFFVINLLQALILLIGFVVFHESIKAAVALPLLLVLVLAEIKVVERTIGLMYSTCATPALSSCPLLKVRYDDDDDDDDENPDVHDLVQGCRYLIGDGITINKIWHCKDDGILLSSTRHQDNHLKDCCLSFSLFWVLLRRFVGIPSYERRSLKDEAWNLVRNGLLDKHGEHERPFRVVEVELTFLYDFFYTKYFGFYRIGFLWQLKHLLFVGVIIWISALYFTASDGTYGLRFKEYDVDTLVTKIVVAIITLMEVTQFIIFITSRWAKMMILCLYVTRKSWNKKSLMDCCVRKAAQIICRVRLHESFSTWCGELNQYSLLESYCHLKCYPSKLLDAVSLITGLFIPQAGRKESKSMKLTTGIKKQVILSLQKHGPKLTNGIASLKASGLCKEAVDKLTWATKRKTDIHVIIVWHVATTLCEADIDELPCDDWGDHFEVATSLSKYCAYLVAFAPKLLPGNAATTDYICRQAIEDARGLLKTFKKPGSTRQDKLKGIAEHIGDIEVGIEGTVVHQGAKLRNLLREISDPKKRWEVLAGFWAEMILFLAPNSNNEMAHAERLVDGGEFITHLWVLLFHAGIVDTNTSSINRSQE